MDWTLSFFIRRRAKFILAKKKHMNESGAPNENMVQNHLNIALLNVF